MCLPALKMFKKYYMMGQGGIWMRLNVMTYVHEDMKDAMMNSIIVHAKINK